jgi:hypothetical protein
MKTFHVHGLPSLLIALESMPQIQKNFIVYQEEKAHKKCPDTRSKLERPTYAQVTVDHPKS